MNEFIVWDKSDNRFWTLQELRETGELDILIADDYSIQMIYFGEAEVYNPDGADYTQWFRKEVEIETFNYIGLKDINDNKIYTDCSIVEFILKDEAIFADFTERKPTIWNEIKMIGYFTFNNEDLRYEIDIIDWEKSKTKSQFSCLYYNFDIMSNFKIIDTIQVNKLGLIK